jgi:polysaccharide biosynthesis transport protein
MYEYVSGPVQPKTSLQRRSELSVASFDSSAAAVPPGRGQMVQLFGALYRRRYLVIACVVCCLGTAIYLTAKQVPVYQSRSAIEFQALDDNLTVTIPQLTRGGTMGVADEGYIQTQVSIMESRSLLARVLANLGLDRGADPQVVPGKFDGVRNWLGFRKPLPLPAKERALSDAQGDLRIKPNRQTRIVELFYESPDPALAAKFLNTLVSEYMDQTLQSHWKASERTNVWLSQKLDELKQRLEQSADKLQSYASQSGLLQYGGENNSISDERLRQLQAELSRAQADRVLKQAQYEAATAIAPGAVAEAIDTSAFRATQSRLTELRAQLADLSSLLTPENYKVKRLKAQIAEIENSLRAERSTATDHIRVETESAQRREAMLTRAYLAQGRLVNEDAVKAIRYDLLKREVDANRQLYDSMLQKVKESRVASAMRASNVRVIDPAEAPFRPIRPDPFLNLSLGLMGGLLMGVTAAFVSDQFDRTLRRPGDSLAYLKIPELGMIPRAAIDPVYQDAKRERNRVVGNGKLSLTGVTQMREISPEIGAWGGCTSLLAESFRGVVASILLPDSAGTHPRVIVLTSPKAKEGKSTVISNLGIALARMNRRVLLIDGDTRRSRLHTIFGVPRGPGLREYLLANQDGHGDEGGIDHLVRSTHIPSLYVLPSGNVADASDDGVLDLLHSPQMLGLFRCARRDFDFVLVDTPPVLQIPDARALARFADAVILIVRAGETSRDLAVSALRRFAGDSTPVLGTILNQWDPRQADSSEYYRSYMDMYRDKAVD